MLPGHLQAHGIRVHTAGDQQCGDLIGKQAVENLALLFVGQLFHVAHFHIAHDLKAHGLKVIQKPSQLQARTGNILHRQTYKIIIRGRKDHFQRKIFHQFA